MDKITHYQNILLGFLQERAAIKYALQPGYQKQVIADRERNHFQLMTVGWHRDEFTCDIVIHFDIVGDKVWIQQNNTELLIADEIIERGIAPQDIVLGFQPEYARAHSGFATV
jgi:XisI protein